MIHLKVTDYPEYLGRNISSLEPRTFEEVVSGSPAYVRKAAEEHEIDYAPTRGAYYPGYWSYKLQRKAPPYVTIGSKASPSTLGHEIGHAFDPSDMTRPGSSRETYAWKEHFKNMIRVHGYVPTEDLEDATDALMSQISPKVYYAPPGSPYGKETGILYRKAKSLTNQIARQAKRELREEGEL